MTPEQIRERVNNLTVWKRGGERAPHKPLLAIYAIARLLRGEPRMIPYADVERDVGKLLMEFGPRRQSYHPEYPFWRLQNDGLWQLSRTEGLSTRQDLLIANFPETLHQDILDAVGLDFSAEARVIITRSPEFRERVLRAYEYSCAVCGFDLRLGSVLVAVEAAHINGTRRVAQTRNPTV